jgi:hypothetical protein
MFDGSHYGDAQKAPDDVIVSSRSRIHSTIIIKFEIRVLEYSTIHMHKKSVVEPAYRNDDTPEFNNNEF